MSDDIMLVFGEDGIAREYDDTWDITIHCESEEEQKKVLERLNNSNQEAKHSTESSLTQKELDTISRQAAIDAFDTQRWKRINIPISKEIRNAAKDTIKALPPAQPEIVRCKDCIKREICRTSTTWAVAPKDDWYCADGERRTDESDANP